MRDAQHHKEDAHPIAKKRKVGTDSDAHTSPARKHKLGGNTNAHTGLVKKQKLGGELEAYMDAAAQGLRAASPGDDSPDLRTRDATNQIVQTEQHLTSPSLRQARASAGAVAAPMLSSWQQPLFLDLVREQHNGTGPAKRAESVRPQKRVQMYESIRASQRCGYCKTCLNRSMKKACLTRRAEMDVARTVAT